MSKNENKNIWEAINISIDSNELDDKTINKLVKLAIFYDYIKDLKS